MIDFSFTAATEKNGRCVGVGDCKEIGEESED
jgi:hypothetical protein